ncbi:YfcC family protein [Robiginitalea aurantiaca]|uniref:Na+/H+ antiporter NhaC family protein n=1 Tax=Robiginitalea aurantiaca TaxID=3056915 RepID=A0ABT7WDC5_9FLAO|nr:Na+/H+ antiporter NhaC family protein [Robiginitalea aurantiaca]MDM9630920.1 Na+/H+ antiporter NhaC family protein [Robiginitalea aurantiaca]
MRKFPNAFVILLGVIVLSWILTFLIPHGTYERVTDLQSGQTTVIGGSYHEIASESLSFFDLLLAIPQGLASRADLIVLILLLGGCFYLIEKTGALGQGLQVVVDRLKGREALALILVSILFAAAGATIGLQEEIIALAPILILFCRSMGYNSLVALGISYGSAVLGAAFSPINPFAVVLAQKEAELPLLSGSGYRLVILGIALVLWIWYLWRYARKNRVTAVPMKTEGAGISWRTGLILFLLCLTFAVVTYGLITLDWGFNEISACFFALGIASGLIGKMGIDRTGLVYIEGMKEMTFAAIIMGMASTIPLLLEKGQILDTIVYALFTPIENLPPSISALGMMGAQAMLHFPVSSYSGQALLSMPILTPLSDLMGISRQVCVLAYQYGAVTMDFIVPTNGALMAIIAVAGIPYNKWIHFIWRPLLILFLVAALGIVTAVFTGI